MQSWQDRLERCIVKIWMNLNGKKLKNVKYGCIWLNYNLQNWRLGQMLYSSLMPYLIIIQNGN